MSIWSWYYRACDEALESDEPERIELVLLLHRATPLFRTEPRQAHALLRQAQAIARRRNEPWLQRFYEHWELQVLLNYLHDYPAALELAVKAAVETRKPIYEQFPQRICIQEDLIAAYVGIDPVGNEQLIRQALDYMEREVSPSTECRNCLYGLRTRFQLELGHLDRALACGMQGLALTQSEPYHQMWAYNHLCEIAFLRGEWEQLAGFAVAGEELANAHSRDINLIEFLAWQALVQRHSDDENSAQRLYRRTTNKVRRMAVPPRNAYFTAICAYHELHGNYHLALKVRDRQRVNLEAQGQLYQLALCLIERCRLLNLIGALTDADLNTARTAIAALSTPAPLLEQLELATAS